MFYGKDPWKCGMLMTHARKFSQNAALVKMKRFWMFKKDDIRPSITSWISIHSSLPQWKLLHPMASVQDCFHDDFCDDDVIHDAQHGPLWVWEPELSGKNRDGFIQWSSNATHFENKSNNYVPNCRRNRNGGVISMIQNAFLSMVMLLFALVIPHNNARTVDW